MLLSYGENTDKKNREKQADDTGHLTPSVPNTTGISTSLEKLAQSQFLLVLINLPEILLQLHWLSSISVFLIYYVFSNIVCFTSMTVSS